MANPVRTIDGTSTYIYAPTDPTDFAVINGGSLELGGVINPADTITVTTSNPNAISSVKIDDVRDSGESIVFNDGVINLDGLVAATASGSNFSYVDAWNLQNGVLSLTSKGQVVAHFNFTDTSPETGKTANIEISQSGTGTYITEGTLGQPMGATLLPGNLSQPQPPATTMPDNPPATVADGSTGQQMICPSQSYTGPVAGLAQQIINITTQNLNIFAKAANLFIHTGSGNDAIQASSGTNVLDGGAGSNFLTGGSGSDTFFVDGRHAASDIWSTVRGFHHGDSATLWGVSAGNAGAWADEQGAPGATGLTLHANAGAGHQASITLAGFNSADLASGKMTATFGHDAASGSDYLYLHGA